MNREHEEAMRTEFTEIARMREHALRASTPETEMNDLFARVEATHQRWNAGAHTEHWHYLDGAHEDWRRRPETMARFLDGVDYDRTSGYRDGMTDIEYRSQCQARDLTAAQRARRPERPPRQRGR
ncbi:hypothetical protein [Nocardia brasiliensis]